MGKISNIIKTKVVSPLQEFIHDSRAVGITLIICTVISLLLSNTDWGAAYIAFWEQTRDFSPGGLSLPHSFVHMINDGLMALFFLLVGMEIKREVLSGELASFKKSILPMLAALGGMLVPAVLYIAWNTDSGYSHGWGIPMATDIAFSLGILSLLGSRAPLSLKILLTALAIIDDLGAIIAIALFYTNHINGLLLVAAAALFLLLLLLNRLKVKSLISYFILALVLWYCLFNSGVHATLAGVLLAFALPLHQLPKLESKLHDPVSFIVLPLFALANTAIIFPETLKDTLSSPINYGILTGLLLGKPLGITLFAWIAVKTGLASLPEGLRWQHIIGMGMIAGIGFTMSIFIAMLAFNEHEPQTTAKISVLAASVLSGILGYVWLRAMTRNDRRSVQHPLH